MNIAKLTKDLNKIATECKRDIINKGRESGIFYTRCSISGDDTFKVYNMDTEEKARKALLDKISNLPYVKIVDGKSGVKTIEVDAGWKILYGEIHAHYYSEVVGQEKVKSLFEGVEDYTRDVYETRIMAQVEILWDGWKPEDDFDFNAYPEYLELEEKLNEAYLEKAKRRLDK